jgi:hypothetical protein
MATIIEQEPLYDILPVGQDIMFTVSNNAIVANQTRVKFIAEVHISSTTAANQNTTTDLIGTFKTTPNNAGVGMFNLSSVVESYVKADNFAGVLSQYKTAIVSLSSDIQVPLHLIDKYSYNNHTMRWLSIRFKVEYLDTTTNTIIVSTQIKDSDDFKIFNGYLKYTDKLHTFNSDFGLDIGAGSSTPIELIGISSSFLTNAPTVQYANITDYGTVGLLPKNDNVSYIKLSYYNSVGASLGSENVSSGLSSSANITQKILYFGCYPANLQNWSSAFQALVTADTISYYTVQAFDSLNQERSKEYTININCPDLRGYESVRLAWLNQWGAWDYYTFTKKSVRSISTKGSTYTQQSGTWNKAHYRPQGYKGGMKSFRVNATERIKMNTDFVNEINSEWFEELINSPEVYMLEGYQTDSAFAMLNTYVTPVRLTTTSYTRKTIANDKLMQYTFEVEKSKTLRTQSV